MHTFATDMDRKSALTEEQLQAIANYFEAVDALRENSNHSGD